MTIPCGKTWLGGGGTACTLDAGHDGKCNIVAVPRASEVTIVEQGWVQTDLGPALRIHLQRHDKAPMGFHEVYDAFANAYPGRWALQCLPPRKHLMNQANKYHLHVLDTQPRAFDLFDRQTPTATRPTPQENP